MIEIQMPPVTSDLKGRTTARLAEIAAAAQRQRPEPQSATESPRKAGQRWAYLCGIQHLAEPLGRLFALEQAVEQLTARIATLEATARKADPPHLANVERRKKV